MEPRQCTSFDPTGSVVKQSLWKLWTNSQLPVFKSHELGISIANQLHASLANVRQPVCPLVSRHGLAMMVEVVVVISLLSLLTSCEMHCRLLRGRDPTGLSWTPSVLVTLSSRTSQERSRTSNVLISAVEHNRTHQST